MTMFSVGLACFIAGMMLEWLCERAGRALFGSHWRKSRPSRHIVTCSKCPSFLNECNASLAGWSNVWVCEKHAGPKRTA